MRVVLVVAAIAAVLVAAGAVLESVLSGPPREPDRAVAAPPETGPFAVAESGGRRVTPFADLTERLRADRLVPRQPGSALRVSDGVLAQRMLAETCQDNSRDCRQAVGTSVIRRVWASLPRDGDPARKAARLLALGERLSLTSIQVRDSIRAELDSQLTLAMGRGAIGWPRRNAAVACFETPADCRLPRG